MLFEIIVNNNVMWYLNWLFSEQLVLLVNVLYFQELTKLISSEDMLDTLYTPSRECGRSTLLEIDERVAQAEITLRRNLLLLGTISALCERLEHQCLSNTTHIIHFVRVSWFFYSKV